MQVEVMIVGAGPAGLAAAIQLKRYGLDPLLLEREAVGGLLRNANLVENYPGFPRGIAGPDLVRLFAEQAAHVGVQVTFDEVLELALDGDIFRASTRLNTYRSQVAVIAAGTQARPILDLPIPERLQPRIFYEIHPLLNLAGKRIAIIGAGDAAFDYALNLGTRNQVILLNRGDLPGCLPLLWERAMAAPGVTYRQNQAVSALAEAPSGGITLHCTRPNGEECLQADYLIAATGRDALLGFVSQSVLDHLAALQSRGTLHLVGDVKNGRYRQTSIAVGDGVLAAMKIYQFLKEKT